MLKYFSQILSKFTQRQRMLVLILLLFGVIIIGIGPKVIKVVTHDDKNLTKRIEEQKLEIDKLNISVIDLNQKIRQSETNCTDKIIEREKYILAKLSEMENIVKVEPQVVHRRKEVLPMVMEGSGSSSMNIPPASMMIPPPPEEDEKSGKMIKEIKSLKSFIKKGSVTKNSP